MGASALQSTCHRSIFQCCSRAAFVPTSPDYRQPRSPAQALLTHPHLWLVSLKRGFPRRLVSSAQGAARPFGKQSSDALCRRTRLVSANS